MLRVLQGLPELGLLARQARLKALTATLPAGGGVEASRQRLGAHRHNELRRREALVHVRAHAVGGLAHDVRRSRGELQQPRLHGAAVRSGPGLHPRDRRPHRVRGRGRDRVHAALQALAHVLFALRALLQGRHAVGNEPQAPLALQGQAMRGGHRALEVLEPALGVEEPGVDVHDARVKDMEPVRGVTAVPGVRREGVCRRCVLVLRVRAGTSVLSAAQLVGGQRVP
mmetsp:Transcript_17415/g.50219  ORF Transcript_17415/g.50219 Transcript_17415/m.50219 type:complete len:227 (-) Transcript_17415:106-786(-)